MTYGSTINRPRHGEHGKEPRRAEVQARGRASKQRASGARPLSCLHREAGLAAVAAELNLPIHTLDLEVAEAIKRGAAALFLAGYGPRPIRGRQYARTVSEGSPRRPLRNATKARRS
jgi:hypothetical protein